VTRHSLAIALGLFLAFTGTVVARAGAQPPAPTTPAAEPATTAQAAAEDDDDHERLRPLEPDFRLVNVPTTLPMPLYKGNFHLTHRFNQNLRSASFTDQLSNLFGLDQGATIQFEYRVGILKHVQAIASRTNVDRTVQFSGKFDVLHQSASSPVGFSAIASIEGGNNFQTRYTPAIGGVVSRTLGSVAAVYVAPLWVHNTAPGTGIDRDTSYVGIGTRIKITPTVSFAIEGSPRLSGFKPGDPEFAFAIEKRVGGHFFSLTFANGSATTYGQLARGGNPEALYFGFNLARKFF
jgi:hypothetical protein